MMITEQAKWVKNGDWYEAREPQGNRLMFRFNPKTMVVEWGYRRRIVLADLRLLFNHPAIESGETS